MSAPVLLAAGGTGGHIFPAVALARAFQSRGRECLLVGVRGGMEEGAAARENLRFLGVRAGKLDRSRPDPRALARAGAGILDAIAHVGRVRPAAVVGFGGFASLPGSAAAVVRRVPLVLHEANALPGLVTRSLARTARAVGVADEAAARHLPQGRAHWVGMPVREVRVPRADALARLGLEPSPPVVLIMPGSQGSARLNRLLPPLLEKLLAGRPVQVLHVTGPGRLDEVEARVRHLPWYRTAESLHGPDAWAAAELAITRAGMGTIADAAYHGVPILAVPLPGSAEDHQTHNARALEVRGAGRLVVEADLERGGEKLGEALAAAFDPAERERMSRAALTASPEGAADRLADLVEAALLPRIPRGG